MKQKIFNYNFSSRNNIEDFYVTDSNIIAYNYVMNQNENTKFCIIYGPFKSGKTHLGLIWQKKNQATIYNKTNYELILQNNNNIFIDNFLEELNEENLFHIINHCYNNNLKILLTTNQYISNFNFKLNDLSSRIKSFHLIQIKEPDDELIVNLIIKLSLDRQIKINNSEIFSYILKRINRTYEDIYLFVENVDKLSLEKKRELTIPLIKELI